MIKNDSGNKEESLVNVYVEGNIGFIALNRPGRANAYTSGMLGEMKSALEKLSVSDGVSVIVVKSSTSGKFCAGADLNELSKASLQKLFNRKSMELFDSLARAPVPTIAEIDGPAAGGGVELALACDIRIASVRAKFFFPEASLGIIPGAGGTWRLPRLVGPGLAREMVLFGRELDSKEAFRVGLVNHVELPGDLRRKITEMASHVASLDPLVLRAARAAIDVDTLHGSGMEIAEVLQAFLYERNRVRREDSGKDT